MRIRDLQQTKSAPRANATRFVGRVSLLRSLTAGAVAGRHYAVVGGPGSGKTALLDELEQQLRNLWMRRPRDTKVAVVRVDLLQQNPGNPQAFWTQTWQRFQEAVNEPLVRAETPAFDIALKPSRTEPAELGFFQCFARWQEAVRETTAHCQVLLCFDNAEHLMHPEHTTIRGALQRWLKGDGAPASVFAGGRSLRELLWRRTEALAGLRSLLLLPLSLAECTELLNRHGIPERADVMELRARTGGHARLTELVCTALAAEPKAQLDDVVDDLSAEFVDLYELIWQALDHDRDVPWRGAYAAPEHVLMQQLIDAQKPVPHRDIERALHTRHAREFAELLEYLGVAQRLLIGDVPHWQAHATGWNRWYRKRAFG